MNSTLQTIFGLCGGLALFLYGMNLMSEGLQKAAGEKMKAVLAFLTKNPVMGVLAGALTTAVLQSSSATTVMVIGFVSAGLMNLPQAISVIMGANIGTTMTAQIIAFKIDDFVWPIVFVGFMIYFISKNEKVKNIGQTIFAFGLLFVGIITMGNVMEPLAQSPIFTELIAKVSDIPILGLLLGTVMTLIVQSSSATIAVLQNFAIQPAADGVSSVIGLTGAIPILLGDNIGTTITALLASVGQSKNAKRAAVAHSVFNIVGSFIFIWIIPWFAEFIRWISPKGNEVDVISRQIANAHTTFNFVNTLLWLPLIWLMVKIVKKIVPGEDERETSQLEPLYVGASLAKQPALALLQVRREVIHVGEMAKDVLQNTKKAFVEKDVNALAQVEKVANSIHSVHETSVKRLSTMIAEGVLSEEQAKQTTSLLYVMGEMDRLGENCGELSQVAKVKQEKNFKFSNDAIREIEGCLEGIGAMLDGCLMSLKSGKKEEVLEVSNQKQDLYPVEARLMKRHMDRIKKGKCSADFTILFSNVLHCLDRMGNNCTSIAEVMVQDLRLDQLLGLPEEENAMAEAAASVEK